MAWLGNWTGLWDYKLKFRYPGFQQAVGHPRGIDELIKNTQV